MSQKGISQVAGASIPLKDWRDTPCLYAGPPLSIDPSADTYTSTLEARKGVNTLRRRGGRRSGWSLSICASCSIYSGNSRDEIRVVAACDPWVNGTNGSAKVRQNGLEQVEKSWGRSTEVVLLMS